MTLADIKARLTTGVARNDLSASYGTFINTAQDEICRRRSWLGMLKNATVTISTGNSSVNLPSDFKELAPGRTPVHYTDPVTGYLIDVEVMNRNQRIRRAVLFPLTGYRVFIDYTTTPRKLNMYDTATENIPFDVTYFGFPAALVNDSDSNFLTTDFPEMLISKVKAIAFAAINDGMAGDFAKLFEEQFMENRRNDSYQAVAGRTLRM